MTEQLMGMDERAARRAFRQFVRAYHPDRGGDPDIFMAGLAELRSGQRGGRDILNTPDVSMVPSRFRSRSGIRPSVPTAYKRRGPVRQLCGRIFTALRNRVEPQAPRVR